MADLDKPKDTKFTPNIKDQVVIQGLVILLVSGTPNHTIQKLSIDAAPLDILVSSQSSSKVEEVI